MKLKLSVLAICLCLLNCKKDAQKTQEAAEVALDYKYNSIEKILDCEGVDTGLIQEAFYSFEDDIVKFYTPDRPIPTRAYSIFVNKAVNDHVDYSQMVSEHSKKVLEALKQQKDLWTNNPDGSHVNFNHPLFKCIGEHIQDEPLQKTYNALIQTNSMSVRMFGDEVKRKTFGMKDDKYLATYVALELYYGKIYDLDLSKKTAVEPVKDEEHSAHDGHNH